MAGEWEVVGKKKHRSDGGKKNKKSQINASSMPKLDEIAPIKESQTMFDAFIEKEKKVQIDQQSKTNNVVSNKTKEAKKKTHKKEKPQAVPKAVSLEEALKDLNVEELKTHLATAEARFPDTPLIWLQDFTSYLNVKLDVEIPDPFFSAKPLGYLSSLIKDDVRKLILSTINYCSSQAQQAYYEACMHSMILDAVKGLNTIGYRIFLQCIAERKPEVVLEAIPKCIDLRNSYQNRQNMCLSVLWAVGQSGISNLEIGLKAWSEVMFPLLGTRTYSKYAIDYLEKLLCCHSKTKVDKSLLSVRDLFPILDCAHSTTGLPGNMQKQLQALYPILKRLSYGPEPQTTLRGYFPSYLRRLEPNCVPSLKTEVLTSLVECLTVDKMSYSIWRQLYTKHPVQSSILINHLHDEWSNLPSGFPKKLLCETLSAFQVTNQELKGKGRISHEIEDCAQACNAVLNKMSAQRFPWLKLVLFATVLVTSLLAYDVQQSGSFQKSKTGQLMKEAGLLAICEQAWEKITVYTGKSVKWLEVNVPIYTLWLRQTFGPYLTLFWERLFNFFTYAWSSTDNVRAWANTNIPPILRIVTDSLPVYMKTVSKYTESFVLSFSSFSFSVYKTMMNHFSAVVAWLHKNVFTGSLSAENLQKYAGNTVQAFQEYTLHTYNWISKHIATVIYPGK